MQHKEQKKEWNLKNKEKILKQRRDEYLKNREKYLLRRKKYSLENKEREYLYVKNKLKNNINFRISVFFRIRLRKALRKNKKRNHSLDYLGCSLNYFVKYLESQFDDEMSWTNYNKNGWHMHHKKACALFNLTKEEEIKKCFHYTNVKPMWAWQNMSIGCRTEQYGK